MHAVARDCLDKRNALPFQRAFEIARKSTQRYMHGCVIMHRGAVVAESCNYIVPASNHSHSIHAEVGAIIRAKKARCRLSECTLYVTRLSSRSEPMLSKPCEACSKYISDHGITRVYFT